MRIQTVELSESIFCRWLPRGVRSFTERCIASVDFPSSPLPQNSWMPTSYNCLIFASRFWGEGQGEGVFVLSRTPHPDLLPPVL